jgi:hypothetical protein
MVYRQPPKSFKYGAWHLICIRWLLPFFSICLKARIELDIQYIPRSLNKKADYLSKIIDYDDWEIKPQLFRLLEGKFGRHTVDCFADYNNCKVQIFYSKFGTQALRAYRCIVYSWEGGNALLVPPVPLDSRVLVFMHSCKAQDTFVVPYWPSAPFRPLLISRFSASIKDHIVFVGNSVLMHGNNHKSLLGSSSWTGYLIAFRLNFS